MSEWHKYPEDPPPTTDAQHIMWYEVKYQDGHCGQSCWWFSGWYCNSIWFDIVAWRELDE